MLLNEIFAKDVQPPIEGVIKADESVHLGTEVDEYVLTNAIHKGVELLLKYEDRLFLNPAARIRAVPKTPPKEEKPAGIAAFMASAPATADIRWSSGIGERRSIISTSSAAHREWRTQ